MPTHEVVIPTFAAPVVAEKPIPTRTVSTKSPMQLKPQAQNVDQPVTSRSESVAESSEPAESVKLSPQLSALARKEQAYRQREQALKAKEKQLEEKLAQAEQYSQLKASFESKDFSKAEELGMTYEEYTKYLLDKQSGEDPSTQAYRKLEAEVQALKKSQEDKAANEYDETVAAYKKEIGMLISTSTEFQRVKKLGKEDAVLQLILDSWEEDGTEMTVAEASKDVEAYLAHLANELMVEQPRVEEPKRLPPPRVGSKTLNQNMAAVGTATKPYKSLQHLSEQERYAEAMRRVRERREAK